MESVVSSAADPDSVPNDHFLLGPALRQVRAAFAAESVDPLTLWLLASEGLGAWIRHLERALGDHLEDRHRARILLATACGEMFRRRAKALPLPLKEELEQANPVETRAFFEALFPGPIGRSIRWSLDGITLEIPDLATSWRAWRRARDLGPRASWLQVSHHLGELSIVLTDLLPKQNVPRAIGWLGDACHAFGKEVGELTVSLFGLPMTLEGAIETLRMGELLFRVNPEHTSGAENGAGFIEGNACLWYDRPGWGPVHCGVLGRFQAGIAELFGRTYSLTQTIPKHGGNTCRITLSPVQIRSASSRSKAAAVEEKPYWQPPTAASLHQGFSARLDALEEGRDRQAGFFGPESMIWQGTRETVILLGGGRAALMQIAHPSVAHAIRDHSVVHRDMLGRFLRTMSSTYNIMFGSVDEAREVSEKNYRIHQAISGALDDVPGKGVGHYYALDPEALFWVGATLIDTTVLVYEMLIRPMTPDERDRLVREAGPFWTLFGVPLDSCPTTWADLHGYVERRVESLAPLVGETARNQAELLFAPHAGIVQPLFNQGRLITAHLLPESLQRAFKMQLGPVDRLLARTWVFAAERMTPWLPAPLRYVPAYHRAERRLSGAAR